MFILQQFFFKNKFKNLNLKTMPNSFYNNLHVSVLDWHIWRVDTCFCIYNYTFSMPTTLRFILRGGQQNIIEHSFTNPRLITAYQAYHYALFLQFTHCIIMFMNKILMFIHVVIYYFCFCIIKIKWLMHEKPRPKVSLIIQNFNERLVNDKHPQ